MVVQVHLDFGLPAEPLQGVSPPAWETSPFGPQISKTGAVCQAGRRGSVTSHKSGRSGWNCQLVPVKLGQAAAQAFGFIGLNLIYAPSMTLTWCIPICCQTGLAKTPPVLRRYRIFALPRPTGCPARESGGRVRKVRRRRGPVCRNAKISSNEGRSSGGGFSSPQRLSEGMARVRFMA